MTSLGAKTIRAKDWWFEPITWRQAEAIAKHYQMTRQQAELVYPTKGAAIAAIGASLFMGALKNAQIDAMFGKIKDKAELRSYFIDDSEGGQNHLGSRSIDAVWDYLKPYLEMGQNKMHPLTTRGGQNLREQAGTSIA